MNADSQSDPPLFLAETIEDLLLGRDAFPGWLDLVKSTSSSAEWTPLIELVARADAARKAVQQTDPLSQNALARALFALLPYLRDGSKRRAAMQQIIELEAHAISSSQGGSSIPSDPVEPSSANLFAILAEQLSRRYAEHAYLDAALALVERVEAHPKLEGLQRQPRRSSEALSTPTPNLDRTAFTSNVIGVCRRLAVVRPEQAEKYLLRALELAEQVYQFRATGGRPAAADASAARQIIWQAARSRVTLHVELAALAPERAEQHIAAARENLRMLETLANDYADADLRRECADIRDQLSSAFPPVDARSGASTSQPGEPPARGFTTLIEDYCRTSVQAALHAQSLKGDDRHNAIHDHVSRQYAELSANLEPLVRELGVSHHISRFLLGFGAAASGRMAPLTRSAVQPFVMHVPELTGASANERRIAAAQVLPSRRNFDNEARCMAIICGVAALVDAASADADLQAVLASALRRANAQLLTQLARAVDPLRLILPSLTTGQDLAAMADLVRGFATPRTAPLRSEADRAAEAADAAQIAIASEQSPIPILDWVEDVEPDGAARRADTPEQLLGKTGRLDGVPHVYESILGMGRQNVVFQVRNLHTNATLAVRVARDTFDSRWQLAAYLNKVSPGGQDYDPQEIIRLTEQVLNQNPTDSVAAFNRGVALALSGAFEDAHHWLQVSLRGEPDDPVCLFYDAYALSATGHHQAAVDQLVRAARQNPRELANFARTFKREAGVIRASLHVLDAPDPSRADTARLIKDLFV
jgi:tetratricopeptide (TPR) repeat protein